MHIESLKIFSILAETASFSKTAQAAGITQSAVSQQLRVLEQRFRVQLIERGSKSFGLTPEGRAFLEASRGILGTLEDLENQLDRMQKQVAGELRIATIFSIGLHELPPLIQRFKRMHDQVDIRIEYRRSSEVYQWVQEGRADLGLVAYPSARHGLKAVTFRSTRLVLICPPRHRLALRRRIPLSALEGEKFIAFEPDLPTRRKIDRKLRDAGVKVRITVEFDNVETVKRSVEIENGVSIVPESAVRQEVEGGTLAAVQFDDPGMARPLGALTRRAARVSPSLREFFTLLQGGDDTLEARSGEAGRSGEEV